MDKGTLRNTYLEKRLSLSTDEYQKRNQLLINRLLNYLDIGKIHFVHSFLAMTDKKEVDTFAIIEEIRSGNPEIRIAISKTLPKGELSHFLLNDQTKIEKNNWGIPEPVEGEAADIEEIDIVLVPLISFDKEGHRIGYGKGYYDRFLKKVSRAKKIGLALTPPLDHIPYSDRMDVRLDACISPFDIYEFSQ
ncbi:5-formyltetrahydrofolate cyclo-ligase [Fulvivirga imtechensis AK7]|uniref:5-formyltetrahydrofolate cyclo-ligase n=1 Tax=Fulvivirga imtechensis AK7 TaxID=1237149 RepID=L8JYC7_9BACT|nr:5-formyltetrahydrofolate cyclo-ligase [Fulvivirga imtechensis]ELR72207.1 5-formyltetrahydrofolate cyclo-ligase [Fulvivirga imtechensis AK7]